MAKFVFKLAGVLRHRKMLEQQKLRDHAQVSARLRGLEDQLKSLNEQMTATNDDIRRNHLTGPLDISFITAHRRFLLGMQSKGLQIVQEMAKVQREVEAARLALVEATREVKVLEKLREKQEQRFREEVSRKELAALDEVGMQLANQSLRESAR